MAADLGNTTVISPTDANNGSGTMPSWSGSAAPSTIDDAGRSLQGAVAREWDNRSFAVTSTGSTNAYLVGYAVAPAAYRTGQVYSFVTNFTVTGSATANINSLGAKTIKKVVAGAKTNLAANDMYSGDFVMLAYDGTDLVWVNQGNDLTGVALLAVANIFTAAQTVRIDDASNSSVTRALTLSHTTSGSPSAGIGVGMAFEVETSASNNELGAALDIVPSDLTGGSEDFEAILKLMAAGATAAEVLRVGSTGLITILGQIKFPATQNASSNANTLDDYEEGSFTPTFTANSDATGVTYSAQVGSYVKIGKLVTVRGRIILTNNGSGVGAARIGGLPFTTPGDAVPGFGLLNGGGLAATGIFPYTEAGTTNLILTIPSSTGNTTATDTNCTNTFDFVFVVTYEQG